MWLQIKTYLTLIVEAFRFVKKYRARQAERDSSQSRERAAEREHQRLLIQAITTTFVEAVKTNQEGLLALAKASTAQADVMSSWIKSFQISNPEPEPSRVLRDEDEWAAEQQREEAELVALLPPELRLAYSLNKIEDTRTASDPNLDFDREGRDF